MTDNSKASNMCNQVLRVIKESHLNYLVKETPYSAYVTIRKRFVRSKQREEALEDTSVAVNHALSDIALRQENIFLKHKHNSLEADKASLQMQVEELEVKLEDLKVKNDCLQEKADLLEAEKNQNNIRLEVTKGQLENKTRNFEKQAEVERNLTAELKETIKKNSKLENNTKKMCDNLIMLECTLKHRKQD